MNAQPQRLDEAALQTILQTLLSSFPEAPIAAIDPGPSGLFVPVPDSLPIGDRLVLEGRNALDLVLPPDRVVVISAWEEARATGASRASVRLAVDPESPATLHLVDARPEHGIFVGVVVSGASASERLAKRSTVSALPPRIGRMRKDELAVIRDVDESILRILGWTAAELVGHRSLEFIHPDDQEQAIRDWMQMLDNRDQLPAVRQRLRRAGGGWAWFEVTNHNLLADPAVRAVVAEMIDVTHEMAAEEALRARERLLRRLTETLPIGVLQATSDGRVVYSNQRLHRILGTPLEMNLADQLVTVAADDRPALDSAIRAALESGIDTDLEVQVRPDPDARARRCMLRLRTLTDELGAPNGAILTLEDVTESARLRAELEQQATHDPLTGLMNRASVIGRLERALSGDGARGTAVIFVDLDRFKGVNDRLGHAAGDEVLRLVADRLATAVRGEDTLGRIGGDEFLIVCTGIVSVDVARRVAGRVAKALHHPATIAGTSLTLQASIGVAFSRRECTADELVARADAAMYESKRIGRGRAVILDLDPGEPSAAA